MAGNYPDAPSNRMLLDRDGTQMYKIDSSNVVTQLNSTQVAQVNDETDGGYQLTAQGQVAKLVIFFPELRDLAGYYFTGGTGGNAAATAVETSTNTTNGIDGTWTSLTLASYSEAVSPNFRSKIQSVSRLGIRAIRFTCQSPAISFGNYPTVHLYGNPSSGENPDRLAIWHPTSDAHITGAYYDWGDVPRSSSADRTCRVKNLSASLTANSIQVSFDALTDTTPSVPGQFTISDDNVTFLATINIGNLSPGGISPVLYVRRNTPADAGLSVWEPRIIAQATTWS